MGFSCNYLHRLKFKKISAIVSILLLNSFLFPSTSIAADTVDDMLVYRGGGDTSIPEYKLRDTGGFESEGTAADVTSAVQYVKVLSKPSSAATEKILCTQDSAGDSNCQIWDGSNWGNLLEITAASGSNGGTDVVYETVSGRALVCYRTTSPDNQTPACRIWADGAWIAPASALSVGATIQNLKLYADPNSNYVAMVTKDGSSDVNVQIWNGTSWGNLQEVSTGSTTCNRCTSFSGAWEASSSDFVISWYDNATDTMHSREFDKSTLWASQVTDIITGLSAADNVWVEMAANPTTDQILAVVSDDDDTLTANYWNGSSWGTQTELAANIGGVVGTNNRLFDVVYEAGGAEAVVTYGSTLLTLSYRVWNSAGTSWADAELLPLAIELKDWHILVADPNSDAIMLTTVGTVNDVDTLEWDGDAWDAGWTSHELAGSDQYETASFAYDYEDETSNTPPTISFNSAAQKTDGSGLVDISIEVDDADLDDTQVKIEYETDGDGACNGPWAAATLAGPATADFTDGGGVPNVDNGQTYQVGPGVNTRIITTSGSNTVTFDWQSTTDVPTGNGTHCLRATSNDDAADATTPDTITLTLDNVDPTGLANWTSFGAAATTQHLNWTSAADTNFDHYEVWYGTSQSDVQNRTGAAVEFDDDDYLALNTASTHHTHIIDLTPDTSYYYKIWAVDTFGNEQTVADLNSATDPTGNSVPNSTTPTSISQATDGSGLVTFTTTIYDVDLEGVEMRMRFSPDGGTTFYNGQIDSATPNYGDLSIDVNDFQIGHTNLIDITEEGPHPVSLEIVWDSKSASNQNGGLDNTATDVIIRVTPRDAGGEIGLDDDSLAFALDNAGPALAEVTPVPTGTTDTTPSYTFSADEGGDITYGGSCASATTTATTGNNTITFNALAQGTYSNCAITVTDDFANDTTLNVTAFTVDTTAPTGLTALSAGASAPTTQALIWSAVTETNFNHYEIWFGTNQTHVQNRTGTATEWDNSDDATLATRTTTGTTITGLSPGTTYYYKIWAVDIAGQEETVADMSQSTVANAEPTGVFVSAEQVFDGGQTIEVSIIVDDADDEDLRAKIEYETDLDGACDGPWDPATLAGTVTATTDDSGGPPDISNGNAYQLGSTATTRIITSAGSNTVNFEWDVVADDVSANGETACLRLTANDDTDDQTTPDTITFTVDITEPTITAGNIVMDITTDTGTADIAGVADVVLITWDNSAAGDNNSDAETVVADLSELGNGDSATMFDDGTNGDATAGDDVYSLEYTIVEGAIDVSDADVHITVTDDDNNENTISSAGTLVVDSESPTAPGSLSLTSNGVVAITFGTPSPSSDFAAYKIHYRTSGQVVTLDDNEISSSSLDEVDYDGNDGLDVTGIANGNYRFNIWVFDDAGNFAKASESAVTVATAINLGAGNSGGSLRPGRRQVQKLDAAPEQSPMLLPDTALPCSTCVSDDPALLERKILVIEREKALVEEVDESLIERLVGRILLQVEERGEAWYVEPTTKRRYYLRDGSDAYNVLGSSGLGITNENLDKIPVGIETRFQIQDSDEDGLDDRLEAGLHTDNQSTDSDSDGVSDIDEILLGTDPLGAGIKNHDYDLIDQLKGRIVLQVEQRGEAWYINPNDGKRYYMADGDLAYQIMRFLALGITNQDLRKIPVQDLEGL
ncbi:MAG: fibronectin type III domain-containing protein [Patescibacteria group bacterium]